MFLKGCVSMLILRKIKELKGYAFSRISSGTNPDVCFLIKTTSYTAGTAAVKPHCVTLVNYVFSTCT